MAGCAEDSKRATGFRNVWCTVFACALAGVLILSLWPLDQPPPVNTGWDKTDHLLAYLVLALLGLQAFGCLPEAAYLRFPFLSLPGRAVLLGLLAFGGAVELLQGLTETRHASWQDMLANGLGILLGWLLPAIWNARRTRR